MRVKSDLIDRQCDLLAASLGSESPRGSRGPAAAADWNASAEIRDCECRLSVAAERASDDAEQRAKGGDLLQRSIAHEPVDGRIHPGEDLDRARVSVLIH